MTLGKELDRLIKIVTRLRGPKGCPWDREQTHKSLQSSLLDETYEFFEAAEDNDDQKMCEELGDLLLQVVLHARIAAERRTFSLEDVAAGISEKLIRRHPHVFGDVEVKGVEDVLENWAAIKRQEASGRSQVASGRWQVAGIRKRRGPAGGNGGLVVQLSSVLWLRKYCSAVTNEAVVDLKL